MYGVALRRGFHKIYFKHKFRLGGSKRDINFCKRQVKMAILGYTLPADNIQKLTAKKTRTNLNLSNCAINNPVYSSANRRVAYLKNWSDVVPQCIIALATTVAEWQTELRTASWKTHNQTIVINCRK